MLEDEVSIGIAPEDIFHDVRVNVKRIKELEDAGFDAFWAGDHVLPFQHSRGYTYGVVPAMEAWLEKTTNIPVIGLICTLGPRRHPIDIALAMQSMALLHPGRVAFCAAAGEPVNEEAGTGVWPEPKERVERTVESIELVRKCFEEEDYFHHQGEYFDTFFYMYNKPEEKVPIFCAAGGPMMAKNAGKHAEGFISVGQLPQNYEEVLIPAFEEGAREANKTPKKMPKMAWINTFYDPDYEAALETARLYGGNLIPEVFHTTKDPRVIEERGKLVRDEKLEEMFCVASEPEEIISRYEEYLDSGVDHIVWMDGSNDPEKIPEVSKKVISYLKDTYSP